MKNEENDKVTKIRKFENINDIVRKKLEREYYWKMKDLFCVEKMDDGFHKYELGKKEDSFIRYITDEELKLIIKLAIDMLEEMKVINNNGVDRVQLESMHKEEAAKEDNEFLQKLYVWERIKTGGINNLIKETNYE